MRRLAFAIALLAAVAVRAQVGGPASTGINGSLLNMFGDIKAFSTQGDVRISDAQGKEISTLPVTVAMLDRKLRVEMDLSEMRGGSIPQDGLSMLKSTGMDRMQLLMDGDSESMLVIYPGLQAYAKIADEQATRGNNITTNDVGKETIDGHPCVKRKLTITDSKGKTQEAYIWPATDLKDFPLQVEYRQKKKTIDIHFKSPTLEKPEAKLFVAPTGYTKYDGVQGLMQAAMLKMLGGGK